MELGQVVDFVIEYNEMHDGKKEKKPKIRDAKQSDWDAFWG